MQFLFRHLHLEKLELYEYNLALDCPFATATFPPAVRSFSLRGYDIKYIKDFLSSFTDIPAHVSLSISGEYDGYHTENTPGNTTHMLPSPPQRHLHTLSRATSVEITGDLGSTWSLVGRALSGDEDPLVEFEVRCLRGRHSFSPPLQLADAVRIFCGAPVVEVRLTNNIIGKIHKAEWVALFDAFPLLEHVAIEDVKIKDEGDAREGLFKALSEPPHSGEARWPYLRRFTLVCRNRAASFINLLPRAVQVRAEQGAKMDQLRIFVVRPPRGEWERQDDGPGETMMNELVSWFEEATWKGFVNDARLDFELTYT